MKAQKLSDIQIRRAKAKDRPIKLFDGDGLFLVVVPEGGKWWRLKYFIDGKEKLISLGTYPAKSLKEAREEKDRQKTLLKQGKDPVVERRKVKEKERKAKECTFQAVAREWLGKRNLASSSIRITQRRLERDVFPAIGESPIDEITAGIILGMIRDIEALRGSYTAGRALSECSQIFRYAIPDRANSDPCRDLRGKISLKPLKHFSAITEPAKLTTLLRAIDTYPGTFVVRSALRLAPLLPVRPGELRQMEWEAVNLETAEWRFLVTKTRTLHIVPLPRQAVEILRELHLLTGRGRYVFPGRCSIDGAECISHISVLTALRIMGFGKDEVTGHGFRATFRTIGREVLGFREDLLEHQLAHNVRDPLGRAYNRTTFLPDRREMMQRWADYLDELKAGKSPARVIEGQEVKANG